MTPCLVIKGADRALNDPRGRPDNGLFNTRENVIGAMYAQICREYSSLPPFDVITEEQILWFYDMMRDELYKLTKPGES